MFDKWTKHSNHGCWITTADGTSMCTMHITWFLTFSPTTLWWKVVEGMSLSSSKWVKISEKILLCNAINPPSSSLQSSLLKKAFHQKQNQQQKINRKKQSANSFGKCLSFGNRNKWAYRSSWKSPVGKQPVTFFFLVVYLFAFMTDCHTDSHNDLISHVLDCRLFSSWF